MQKFYLEHEKLTGSIERLCLRIGERFPGSGLLNVCENLLEVARQAEINIGNIGRPNWRARLITFLFVMIVVFALVYAVMSLNVDFENVVFGQLIQISEAALNEIILIGAAVIFLVSLENRIKRKKIITEINGLRFIAHIIDMHQLTKDPKAATGTWEATEHSPKRKMTPFELSRYLDYCSEMLSFISKVGFLYIQDYNDPQTVNAVNELEVLTTGLSQKIWQKIMLIRDA